MTSRFSTVTWFLLFAAAAFALYLVKYRVQDIRDEVTGIESELRKEKETLVLLQAEWSYLNRPEHLRKLADKYLKVKMPSTYDMTDISVLPMKGQPFVRVNHMPSANGQALAEREASVISVGER